MNLQNQVGSQAVGDGVQTNSRAGNQGDLIVSELQGRFYEQCYRGSLYCFGLSNTAMVAANAIATGLGATAQPVIGVWNSSTAKNLVILQAIVNQTTIANTAVSSGGYMWVYSLGNSAITTGSLPLNCRSLVTGGSIAKAFAVSTALTGLASNLAVLRASAIGGINAAGPATAITQPINGAVENVDGSIIVPPYGVVAIMGQVSTTTISVSVSLLWGEVPILGQQ
jgi:hypothetical protein